MANQCEIRIYTLGYHWVNAHLKLILLLIILIFFHTFTKLIGLNIELIMQTYKKYLKQTNVL